MRLTILLALGLLLTPMAAGQALSADENTLYVYEDLSLQTTPPSSGTTSGGTLSDAHSWELPMTPALAAPASLDLEGFVEFSITLGGSVHVGEVDVSVRLQNGATLVADGAAQHHSLRTGYDTLTWMLPPLVDRLDPSAGNLVATIEASGTASSYFLDTDASWIVLPVVATAVEAPEVHNITIDDVRVARDFGFNQTTNRTETITWLQGPSDAVLALAGNITAGSVALTIMDANGTVAFNQTLDAPTASQTNLTGLAAGAWNITLQFEGFIGQLSLTLDEPVAEPDSNETATPPEPEGNETADPQDSPGPSLLLALLAAVVLARRR